MSNSLFHRIVPGQWIPGDWFPGRVPADIVVREHSVVDSSYLNPDDDEAARQRSLRDCRAADGP
jgi:hypothetical protein